MTEKKNSTISEVIADIAVTPITIASMAVKAKRKIEETPTKTGTIGSDVKDAKDRAAYKMAETAQKIQDSDVTQKIKEKVEDAEVRQRIKDKVSEIGSSENAAKIQDAVDTASNKVKNFAYQLHDDMTEGVIKAKNDIDDLKARRNNKDTGSKETTEVNNDKPECAASTSAEPENTEPDTNKAASKPKDATEILMETAKGIK